MEKGISTVFIIFREILTFFFISLRAPMTINYTKDCNNGNVSLAEPMKLLHLLM